MEQELGGAGRRGWCSSPLGAAQRRSSTAWELAIARCKGRGMASDAVRRRMERRPRRLDAKHLGAAHGARKGVASSFSLCGGGVERGRRWSRDAVDLTIGVVDGGGEPSVVVAGDMHTNDNTIWGFEEM
ncbi:Os06g0582400 [Oryza sativa Japonica Group]|uniref:Os06g0582400 protein n=2 Tax=Oryza TaxID=4527 RepID=Q5VPA2_ORYSJ|nr:unknown protein [Oryza sativa Japonica Group]BAH93596.1 Os06g0582400 [Oryza sativa Japonica Group]|eukprot:NP_001174868.1 Os06g0582400 [Oryza sativa Japonica Group]